MRVLGRYHTSWGTWTIASGTRPWNKNVGSSCLSGLCCSSCLEFLLHKQRSSSFMKQLYKGPSTQKQLALSVSVWEPDIPILRQHSAFLMVACTTSLDSKRGEHVMQAVQAAQRTAVLCRMEWHSSSAKQGRIELTELRRTEMLGTA